MSDAAAPAASPGIDQLFPWQGAAPGDLELACTQIARRLIASGRKAIGFAPSPGSGDLLPLLVRLGAALYPFQERQVAVVPDFKAWNVPPSETRRLGIDEHGPSVRPLPGAAGPTLLVPPPCPDAETAALSLQLALRRADGKYPQVLIDLSSLAGVDAVDLVAAARLCDGVAVVGTRGRTMVSALRRTAGRTPSDKSLGVLLIGD